MTEQRRVRVAEPRRYRGSIPDLVDVDPMKVSTTSYGVITIRCNPANARVQLGRIVRYGPIEEESK